MWKWIIWINKLLRTSISKIHSIFLMQILRIFSNPQKNSFVEMFFFFLFMDGCEWEFSYTTQYLWCLFLCFLIIVLLATYKYLNYMIRFVTINIQIIFYWNENDRNFFFLLLLIRNVGSSSEESEEEALKKNEWKTDFLYK